jgi:hypothetical protein
MESITGSKSTMIAVIASVVALLGSFLTWVSISGFGSAGGMDDGGDGVITLVVAIATAAAAVFLKDKARMIAVVIGGAIIAGVGIINVLDIFSTADDFGLDASVGIGLWMVLVGGIAAIAAAFLKK